MYWFQCILCLLHTFIKDENYAAAAACMYCGSKIELVSFSNLPSIHRFIFNIVRQHLMIADMYKYTYMYIYTSACTMYLFSSCVQCACLLNFFPRCSAHPVQLPERISSELLHVWCMKLRPGFCQWDGMLSLLSCYNSCRSSADLATEK